MSDVYRDTWKAPRLWMFDAKVWFFVPPLVLHLSYWTIGLFLAFAALVTFTEKVFGMGIVPGARAFWSTLLGKYRPARPAIRRRRLCDYQLPRQDEFF